MNTIVIYNELAQKMFNKITFMQAVAYIVLHRRIHFFFIEPVAEMMVVFDDTDTEAETPPADTCASHLDFLFSTIAAQITRQYLQFKVLLVFCDTFLNVYTTSSIYMSLPEFASS